MEQEQINEEINLSNTHESSLNSNEAVPNSEMPDLHTLLEIEKDKFIRLFAEFDNYKKRVTKERIELFKTAGQEILVSLLPILDDFERGLKEISKSGDTEMTKGIELIHTKFSETLKNKGLTPMETNQGDDFNLDKHEAITQIPAPTEELKNKIIDTVERGYLLGDKVIRYAKVVIGK